MAKTIYLIEDDGGIIDVYKTGLEMIGKFKVEAFQTCFDARKRIEEIISKKVKKPDLILLDLLLPECNGIQILEELKSKEETRDIPVFVLTNYGGDELQKMGVKLKVEEYLIKSATVPSKLVEIVKEKLK